MFDRLLNRLAIRGELVVMTGLHIGSGDASMMPSAAKMPIMRDAVGDPFIPGSSIKGVLRSFSERVTNDAACIWGEKCTEPFKNVENRKAHENVRQLAERIEAEACVVCRLFGSQVLAAKLSIHDALLTNREAFNEQAGIELRMSNAINRDTRTVDGGKLFSYEVVPAGTSFTFCSTLDNLAYVDEAQLLTGLLELMRQGELSFGGKRSRGLGGVRLENLKIRYIEGGKDLIARLSRPEPAGKVIELRELVSLPGLVSREVPASV